MITPVKREVSRHVGVYTLLGTLLVLGMYLRVYRIDEILGFYFDQGRDAKVIWDLWHNGKLFLIGPTTGIAGIFRGPFYYYLIAPFYLFGRGNPVWPSMFLSFTTMIAVLFSYYLGWKFHSRMAGLIAAMIGSLSLNLVVASRWLSNPTPMLLLSMVLVWGIWLVVENNEKWRVWGWPMIAFVAGSSLFHFGSAGEFFYFPILLIVLIWAFKSQGFGRGSTLTYRSIVLSLVAFIVTAAPLILFDLRHGNLLSGNISGFVFGEGTFGPTRDTIMATRLRLYFDVFAHKIFQGVTPFQGGLLMVVALYFLYNIKKFWSTTGGKILILLMLGPTVGLFYFKGNGGNVYGYYLTGYFLIFILLVSIVLGDIWKHKAGKIFVLFFMWTFLSLNLDQLNGKLNAQANEPNVIFLENQKQAIDWIYKDAGSSVFNVDVYVPPVVPHAYDYLFRWYGGQELGREPETEQVDLLYTLYEVDPPHPERLQAWVDRQDGIGTLETETMFGGIGVQRRSRVLWGE